MKWYTINENYINYLKQFDDRVPNINYNKHLKPFLGIVLHTKKYDYFCPITSYKAKFAVMKDSLTFMKIKDIDANRKILGALCLNYMLPVPKSELTEITSKNIGQIREFSSQEEKGKYWKLLKTEMKYINNIKDMILQKTEKLHYIMSHSETSLLHEYCLNFNELEEKCMEYEIHKSDILYPDEDKNKKIADKLLYSMLGKTTLEYNNRIYIIEAEHEGLSLDELDDLYQDTIFDNEYYSYAQLLLHYRNEAQENLYDNPELIYLDQNEIDYFMKDDRYTDEYIMEADLDYNDHPDHNEHEDNEIEL